MSARLQVRELGPEDLAYVMSCIHRSKGVSHPYRYALQVYADFGLLIGDALVSADDPRVILAFSTVPSFRYARRGVRSDPRVQEYLRQRVPLAQAPSQAIGRALILLYDEYTNLKESR